MVKWVGFPDPTWEYENGIPKFIRNYYEKNPAKLGKVLPNPKIKHSKAIGDTVIHKLSWGDEPGAEWMSDDFFKLLDELKQILYDDMCHLKRFCENPDRAGQNQVTEVLARVQKHVDKFHFREAIDQKVENHDLR